MQAAYFCLLAIENHDTTCPTKLPPAYGRIKPKLAGIYMVKNDLNSLKPLLVKGFKIFELRCPTVQTIPCFNS